MPVPSSVIDFFVHPTIGQLTNHLDGNGPYGPGDHLLTTWSDGGVSTPVANSFGVLVIVNGAIPPKLGYAFGASMGGATPFDGTEYQDRMLQVVVQHQLLLGLGGWITSQLVDIYSAAQLVMWEQLLPGRLGLYVAPGLHFDLQFLITI